jgi:hypothetical protein
MTSILDEFPYPLHDRTAQQLCDTLSQLYPNGKQALFIVQRTQINRGFIDFNEAPIYVWQQVLEQAAKAGETRRLVEVVIDDLPAKSPVRPFLIDLMAVPSPPAEQKPPSPDRALQKPDTSSGGGGLLYHDDLTIQIGRLPHLIVTLQRLVALAPSVCRFEVDLNGRSVRSSGFRIAPDLLLTNWHVLHNFNDGTRASSVNAEFGYEDDGQGGALQAVPVTCNVESIVSNKEDDWAIIRMEEILPDRWPIVKLSEAIAPELGRAAYIIQHPRGERKRVGFVRNQVTAFNDRIVHYLTDTAVGSAGAPVFNDEGQLIALHHAAASAQNTAGRAPVKEGIRISRIVAGLAAAGVTVP